MNCKLRPSSTVSGAAIAAGLAFLFYLPGLARDPMPGDSSIYLVRAIQLEINSYAQTHSLYLVILHFMIKAVPGFSPILVGAFLSAICAALTVGIAYLTAIQSGGRGAAAAVTAAAVGAGHTMWLHAEFAEVYALNMLFMSLLVYCSLRALEKFKLKMDPHPEIPWLFALGMVGGLATANHLLATVTFAICFLWMVVFVRGIRDRLVSIAVVAAGGLIGGSFLLYLYFSDVARLGLGKATQMALFGGSAITSDRLVVYSSHMMDIFSRDGLRQVGLSLLAMCYNFPAVILILAGSLVYLVASKAKKQSFRSHAEGDASKPLHPDTPIPPHTPTPIFVLLLALSAVHFLFGATYTIHEGWAFLLPAWLPLAIVSGLSIECLLEKLVLPRLWTRVSFRLFLAGMIAACNAAVYAASGPVISTVGQGLLEKKLAPHYMLTKDQYLSYYLWPPRNGLGRRAEWLESALAELPNGASAFLSPPNRAMAYYYQEAGQLRRDVSVRGVSRSAVEEALSEGRIVYVDRLQDVDAFVAQGKVAMTEFINGLWRVKAVPGT